MDAPRCLKCLEGGLIGQTYKMCGISAFKCGSCGVIAEGSSFKEIDFKWKTHPDEWASSAKLVMENKRSENGKKRIVEIVEQAKS